MKLSHAIGRVVLAGFSAGTFGYLQTCLTVSVPDSAGNMTDLLWAVPQSSQLLLCWLAGMLGMLAGWMLYSLSLAFWTGSAFKTVLIADARTYWPLNLLLLPLLQFQIVFRPFWEGLMLLALPGRLVLLWAVILSVAYLKQRQFCTWHITPVAPRPWHQISPTPTRTIKIAVLCSSFIIYALVGTRIFHTIKLGGDEPHYLLIAHSLVFDHDLAIGDNYPIPRRQGGEGFKDL